MHARPASLRWTDQLALLIVPTYACNLRCAHCRVADHDGGFAMTLEQFVELMRDAKASGVRRCQITGGEFFAWKHHRAALEATAALELLVEISSNGTLIEPSHVELLRSARAELCLSLDGPELHHDALRGDGAYGGVARAAALCRERSVPFDLSCTVTRSSLPQLCATVHCAAELGARAIRFSPVQPLRGRWGYRADEGLDDGQLVGLVTTLTALHASSPPGLTIDVPHLGPIELRRPSVLYVTPDGTVLPQSQHVHRGYALGNAFEQGLGSLLRSYWGSLKHQRFQRLCRQIYQDEILSSDRPFFVWDELLREASARPPLPTFARPRPADSLRWPAAQRWLPGTGVGTL